MPSLRSEQVDPYPEIAGGKMTAQEIIERILTMHWDMNACRCWICNNGRQLGFAPRDEYLEHKNGYKYAHIQMPEREKLEAK